MFHRLTIPSYTGGLPAGYDYINNATSGTPALADGPAVLGPNTGTYFEGFSEDATSAVANRPHFALAENTDYLDNLMRRDIAVATRTSDVLAGVAIGTITLTGPGIFLGVGGTPNTTAGLNTIFSVVDSNDNEIIVPATGAQCMVTAIVGGTVGTGFSTGNIDLTITPAIPAGVRYRVYYGTRTNLATMPVDAFTNIKIRGAQELPAGFEDFVKQISRKPSTDVIAVVGTIFETPDGIRLSKSNTMNFDVDPDASVGGVRQFIFRKTRDTVSTILAMFTDSSALVAGKDKTLTRPTGFVDYYSDSGAVRTADMLVGSNQSEAFVPWTGTGSSNGDRYLRVHDVGINGAPSTVASRSITRALNARQDVTIGDGVTSFGDFNGANALRDAIHWAAAVAPSSTLYVKMKRGSWTCTQSITSWPAEVVIEGTGKQGTVINWTQSFAFMTFSGSTMSRIALKNLTLNGGIITTRDIIDTGSANPSGGILVIDIDDCQVYGALGVLLRDTHTRFSSRRTLWQQNQALNGALISGSRSGIYFQSIADDTDQIGPYFEDCTLYGTRSIIGGNVIGYSPVTIGAPAVGTNPTIIDACTFLRCKFFLQSTSITFNGSERYLTTNPGCIAFELPQPATSWPVGAFQLNKLTLHECTARALHGADFSTTPILLHLFPANIALPWNDVNNSYCAVLEVDIQGGSFQAPASDLLTCPFLIAMDGAVVTLEDVAVGWEDPNDPNVISPTYPPRGINSQASQVGTVSSFTSNLGYQFFFRFGGAWIPQSYEGAMCAVMGQHVLMRDIRMMYPRQAQNGADIFVSAGVNLVVDTVEWLYWAEQTAGTPPRRRFWYRTWTDGATTPAQQCAKATINNLRMTRNAKDITHTNTVDWVYPAGGFVLCEAANTNYQSFAGVGQTHLSNIYIDGFIFYTAVAGRVSSYGHGILFTGSWNGLCVEKCVIDEVNNGISWQATGGVNTQFSNAVFRDNRITDGRGYGIWLVQTNTGTARSFTNIFFQANTLTGHVGLGLYMETNQSGDATVVKDGSRTFSIIGNVLSNNNAAGAPVTQGQLYSTTSTRTAGPVLTFFGNTVSDAGFQVNADKFGGSPRALQAYDGAYVCVVRGVETGFDASLTRIAVDTSGYRLYDNGADMMFNAAALVTP